MMQCVILKLCRLQTVVRTKNYMNYVRQTQIDTLYDDKVYNLIPSLFRGCVHNAHESHYNSLLTYPKRTYPQVVGLVDDLRGLI